MLAPVTLGAALVALTIAIHAFGTTAWVRYLLARYADSSGQWRPRAVAGVLVATGIVLVALHSIEVSIWALAYLSVPSITAMESVEQAFYFSFVTFTTLGYGDVTLESSWRIMSGIEALGGILLVGWSTALLFAVIQRSWRSGG